MEWEKYLQVIADLKTLYKHGIISIKDIAKAGNVSIGMASRYVNGKSLPTDIEERMEGLRELTMSEEEHRRRMLEHAKGKTKGKKQIVLQLSDREVDLMLGGLECILKIRSNRKMDEVSIEQMMTSIRIQTNK